MVKVASLVRCHRRTWQLEGVLDQCLNSFPEAGVESYVILMPDRPTEEVSQIVVKWQSNDRVIVVYPPEADGHRWAKTGMQGLNAGLSAMEEAGINPDWVHFRDDDEMLGIGWKTRLKKCLEDKDTLAWLAVSLYIWYDRENESPAVNINQLHYSPIFFRWVLGDRFPEDGRSTQVTSRIQQRILRNKYRKRTLPFYLYDFGVTNYTQQEREDMVKRMNEAGKDDGYTRAFVDEPVLVDLDKIIREDTPPLDMITYQLRRKGLLNEPIES